MKRKCLLLFLSVWIVSVFTNEAYPQLPGTLILSENFTDTVFPKAGWVADAVTRVSSSGSYVSPPAAASFGSYNGSLILPVTGFPSMVKFQLGRTSSTAGKLMIVEVSTNGDPAAFSPVDTFSNDNTVSNTFTLCETDLSAYSHLAAVWIRFRKTSATTSPWRIDDIEVYTTPTLPVTLLGFEASVLPNGYVDLQWSTSSEDKNQYFEIERGKEPGNFNVIGRIKGAGYSGSIKCYRFTDVQPSGPICYYRLKQTDYDGNVTVLPVIQVMNKSGGALKINSVSNQLDGELSLEIENNSEGHVHLLIVDCQGKIHYSDNLIINGIQKIAIKKKLSPGIYVIHVSDLYHRFTRKFSVDF